jgi:integrase
MRSSSLYPIAAVGAFKGARRGEILALRWSDFDPAAKTLRISRATEQTRQRRIVKGPTTERGIRVITIDEALSDILLDLRDRYLRYLAYLAGIGLGDSVDLSLVRLPEDALIFS